MTDNLENNETDVVEDTNLRETKRRVKNYAIKTATQLTIAFAAGFAVATIIDELTKNFTKD